MPELNDAPTDEVDAIEAKRKHKLVLMVKRLPSGQVSLTCADDFPDLDTGRELRLTLSLTEDDSDGFKAQQEAAKLQPKKRNR